MVLRSAADELGGRGDFRDDSLLCRHYLLLPLPLQVQSIQPERLVFASREQALSVNYRVR